MLALVWEDDAVGKKIDLASVPHRTGTSYPPPYDAPCKSRDRQPLGVAAGLTQFGVNLLRLPPGQWSSQRHWQHGEDEFVYVIEGEVVLVTDAGDEAMRAGDCAGFKGGEPNGHHFQNRSHNDALLLEVGTRLPGGDGATYPDIDLRIDAGASHYLHRDGTPYE
jgi:uncharacterized cupin superfamily protein